MSEKSLPLIGKTHAIQGGVRMWRPHFQELRVSHRGNGHVAIAFLDSGRAPVVFELDADQRDEFIELLLHSPDLPQVAQPAAQGVAHG